MQTFLPYPDLRASCVVLDDRRLGKQRVETFQVLRALTWPEYAWKNHPAVRMWRGFVPALVEYGVESCREWTRRGYADAVAEQLLAWTGGEPPSGAPLPPWFGLEQLHLSHRSALLRKDPDHYRPLFGPHEPDDLPYLWPPAVFPRWPVRGGVDGLPAHAAARLLGLDAPLAWQRSAVDALADGRDVLLIARPGAGGTTAGLLAALSRRGRTLWVTPWAGPTAPPAPAVPLPAPRSPAAVPADRPPPIARAPGPADVAAMVAEQAPPEFRFAHPDALPALDDDVTLVVVDGADRLSSSEAAAVAALAGPRPLLLLTGRADDACRAELRVRYAGRSPVHVGGGWDVTARLEVVEGAARGRRALAGVVRDGAPALVVVADRARAERAVTALAGHGLRVTTWAPAPMRAARAAEAVAGWRARRVDALVVPVGELPPLGRVRPRTVAADADAVDVETWRDVVERLGPDRAVLVTTGDPGGECRRAALLRPFGEPVAAPCGRCDVCAPVV